PLPWALPSRACDQSARQSWGGLMWTVQVGRRRHDSARVALVTAGFAVVLGGAALFGSVAHTKIPFRMTGTSPPDSLDTTPRPAGAHPLARHRPVELLVQSRPAEPSFVEPRPVEVSPPIELAGPPPEPLPPKPEATVLV